MRERLKNIPLAKYAVIALRTFALCPSFAARVRALAAYFSDYQAYRKLERNSAYELSSRDLFPRIYDKTASTDVDPVYFIQGCWCAKKVFEARPEKHFDIGSQALMVGIISQFAPTTMVDIRPLSVSIPGLSFVKGDITALPFRDGEIASLSSICVIEHIGLGRYGDPLDQFGTEKAARELSRVLRPGGDLYISVPVDSANKTYFNAHRAFSTEHVLELFKGLTLAEEKYIYGRHVYDAYDASKGFGTGLYHFKKR
jgi:SAM-dependent methyltransferase